jgi:hypothetical protein
VKSELTPPLVLASSVSLCERRALESLLKPAGFEVRGVECADEARDEISGHGGGACVLVIDSGLLVMKEDAQWRLFRALTPDLGTVIRCWIHRDPGIERADPRTFLVHPDDERGLVKAVRTLGNGWARH